MIRIAFLMIVLFTFSFGESPYVFKGEKELFSFKTKNGVKSSLCIGDTTFHALPKLPHSRHDTARAQRVDGDGGFKAAIWGGALAARHACVVRCKPERYHSVMSFCGGSSS
jgi:hypothetical protein